MDILVEIPKTNQKNRLQKCQRRVLWECTNASFPKDVKSIFFWTLKGIRILVATFSCASKNSCSPTFFTKLYVNFVPSQIVSQLTKSSPRKDVRVHCEVREFSWPKSGEYFEDCCFGFQLVGRFSRNNVLILDFFKVKCDVVLNRVADSIVCLIGFPCW